MLKEAFWILRYSAIHYFVESHQTTPLNSKIVLIFHLSRPLTARFHADGAAPYTFLLL